MSLPTLALRLTAGALLSTALAAQAGPSQLIVFGDSLSDIGNVYAATAQGGNASPPAPYWQGRFSNGPVAVEYLAGMLGVSLQDYAWGGATTGLKNVSAMGTPIENTGVAAQLQMFRQSLAATGGKADPNALYFVWAGANDLRSAGAAAIGTAVTNLSATVQTLYDLGARNFLLPLLPDLGLTAEAIAMGQAAQVGGTALTNAFNATLTNAYGTMAQNLVGEHFIVFDTASVHRAALSSLAASGGNVTTACINSTACIANPGQAFYWDGIHPTTMAHQMVAVAFANAVPEPASWGLAGLALAGLALSSRRRARAAVAA